MRKNKKTANLTFLGLLCGGILLLGIGVGVQLVEVSALSYGGEALVENTSREDHMVVELSPQADQVNLLSYDATLYRQLRQIPQIEARDTVMPGTVEIEFRYNGLPIEFSYFTDQVQSQQSICFYWFTENEISTMFTCKDAILEDLKQGQLCDYSLWDLREIVVRAHPDDIDRISLS